jgi:hypothetical protein
MTTFHLSKKTSNKKLGRIASSTSSADTCTVSCPLYHDCYAKRGPQSWHWAKVTKGERGVDFDSFCEQVESLKPGTMFRHNVSGDLPYVKHYEGETWRLIDTEKLDKLQCAAVNADLKFYTYTHLHTDDKFWAANRGTILRFSQPNFVINVSTETVSNAVNRWREGFDVVITDTTVFDLAVQAIKENKKPLMITSEDHLETTVKVIPCPEQYTDTAKCETCKLCAKANRNFVVAFKKH